ncbi:MAG: hypothetical protein JEZ07_20265 [Phycisphaerae bacterium]|nr:hypothetical protein [Phycisphaerae bacterium]
MTGPFHKFGVIGKKEYYRILFYYGESEKLKSEMIDVIGIDEFEKISQDKANGNHWLEYMGRQLARRCRLGLLCLGLPVMPEKFSLTQKS